MLFMSQETLLVSTSSLSLSLSRFHSLPSLCLFLFSLHLSLFPFTSTICHVFSFSLFCSLSSYLPTLSLFFSLFFLLNPFYPISLLSSPFFPLSLFPSWSSSPSFPHYFPSPSASFCLRKKSLTNAPGGELFNVLTIFPCHFPAP